MSKRMNCLIINFWSCVNYGASLTCLGTQTLFQKIGLNVKVINYKPKIDLEYNGSFSEEFAKKYLNLTDPVKDYNDFIDLNEISDIFVTGSDQVWNASIMRSHASGVSENIYLLDFVKPDKKKISYAASFGMRKFNGSSIQKEQFGFFAKQFDAISVREDDGREILKSNFNISSEVLIDGAFHIPESTISEMINSIETHENKPYIGVFCLPYSKDIWYMELIEHFRKTINIPVKFFNFDHTTSVEEWLVFIKNSNYIITDSYHATIFAIRFNKDFCQINNANTQSRFDNIYRLLSIEGVTFERDQPVNSFQIKKDWDWVSINEKIAKEVEKAESWVKQSIYNKKSAQTTDFYLNIFMSTRYLMATNPIINRKQSRLKYCFYRVLEAISFGYLKNKFRERCLKYKG